MLPRELLASGQFCTQLAQLTTLSAAVVEILHDALHFGQMHLLLLEDELLARLTAEIQYQRLRTDDDPVRPPFSLFYWRLDGRSALIDTFFTAGFPMDYVFRRTTWKDPLPVSWSSNRTQAESLATTEWPRPPPFRVYCSGNALMASMRRRVAQVEPAPLAAIARIRVRFPFLFCASTLPSA